MSKNIPALRINFDYADFSILSEKLLPYQLKGALSYIPDFSKIKTRADDIQRQIAIQKCSPAITTFFANRVLPITRENAKKIYNLLGFSQEQDDISKAKIAILCRALSLQDNYWVKLENDPITWEQVSLRNNHLNEAIAQVSLHGSSLSLQPKKNEIFLTPELTGQGAYAKA